MPDLTTQRHTTVPAATHCEPLEHHSHGRELLANAIRRGIEDGLRIGGHGQDIGYQPGRKI